MFIFIVIMCVLIMSMIYESEEKNRSLFIKYINKKEIDKEIDESITNYKEPKKEEYSDFFSVDIEDEDSNHVCIEDNNSEKEKIYYSELITYLKSKYELEILLKFFLGKLLKIENDKLDFTEEEISILFADIKSKINHNPSELFTSTIEKT